MTTSNDRLDRIEVLVGTPQKTVQQNAEAIDKLTDSIGRFNQHLNTYESGIRWVVQSVFALLISAMVALIINAAAFLVKLLLPF